MNRAIKKSTVIIAIIGVVVLAAAAAALSISIKNARINAANTDVKDVSLKFLQAVKDGRTDEAKKYLSAEGLKTYDDTKLKQIAVPELTMIGNPEAGGNEATIVHGNKQQNKYIKLTMVKENNGWKISDVLSYTLSM